ncbi:hypothetical protein HYT92_03080, partial [Candidatus Pacearchaeota archaeon]|nr:hypothetical protein [Candidatus Pacearchaeota archaeon]
MASAHDSEKEKKGLFGMFSFHKKEHGAAPPIKDAGKKGTADSKYSASSEKKTGKEKRIKQIAELEHRYGVGLLDMLKHMSLKRDKMRPISETNEVRGEDKKPGEQPARIGHNAPSGEVRITGLGSITPKEGSEKEKHPSVVPPVRKEDINLLATYDFVSDLIPITIKIYKKKGEFVPIYEVSISIISKNTEIILEKIREELTTQVSLGMVDILSTKDTGVIEQKFID